MSYLLSLSFLYHHHHYHHHFHHYHHYFHHCYIIIIIIIRQYQSFIGTRLSIKLVHNEPAFFDSPNVSYGCIFIWIDRWIDGWMHGWIDKRIDGVMCIHTFNSYIHIYSVHTFIYSFTYNRLNSNVGCTITVSF